MRIGIYHGYELTGSGSNEYTRYLSRALVELGHTVHILCREPAPAMIEHVSQAFVWSADGSSTELFVRDSPRLDSGSSGRCVLHQLPDADVQPVFLADKQRAGNVKEFPALTDAELRGYHELHVRVVTAVLARFALDVLHANHTVYQPVVAAEACEATGTPFVVFPHGSAIEYVVRRDARYAGLARRALLAADGVITGNREVNGRLLALYPDDAAAIQAKSAIVGVGVDTTLFQPIAPGERTRALQRAAAATRSGGKTVALASELRTRLANGDWRAVADYRNAYDQSQPDTDLGDKLGSVREADRILLFVGALTAGKGLQTVIAALPELLASTPNTRLMIVGSGRYREVLEAFVHAIATRDEALLGALIDCDLGLAAEDRYEPWSDVRSYHAMELGRDWLASQDESFVDRVLFLGRFDHEHLRHVFPCADLSVFPSVIPEAYPLVLMESLANGVLPVVTDFSGFTDALAELEQLIGGAWVDRMRVPELDDRVPTLVSKLRGLIDDPEAVGLRPVLRQIAVERYDWGVRAVQMESAYESLCGRVNAI